MCNSLTVLGTCGAWPEAGRAASGFLLEAYGFRLVLDLGYATLPRLLARCTASEVDAVVITHEHPDHCADLSALCRVLLYGGGRRDRVPLYCPTGVLGRVQAMEPTEDLHEVFESRPLPGLYQVGPFLLNGRLLPHHVPHAGVRLTGPNLSVAYSGDAGPDHVLGELATGTDLLVAGATLQGATVDPYLLSATQAGQWAARAGVARLVLTHFWPGADRRQSVAEAGVAYTGEILTANEGMTLAI
ncbi:MULTISPECIES: MBL fold metallo-hydrolase [Streptomyces]|nr:MULTISPECIES: MBL fold metallo-hydrolase [Streptomyces]MBZ6108023.1 MBL fold metallo-hydrolase [Streptomyces olivaceus]MCM8555451.1 MBL fold metallo-hydrolase [Streptomyces sp. STCH 565 A]WGK50727.1 MBL fold metallo-hydrolase [Streptomyces sp. B146]GHI92511.1 MBL fold metallo-hydrolase [Streptomyces olivaceus]GHI95218.1 MBL fold metallo-hydrolase [Streptomyces olivaceus]